MVGGDEAFFLDTSTQINKTWEDEKIRSYINKELSKKPCYSSVYVKNEYKLNIINDTILVHNITVDSSTLDEAESRLENLMKSIGRRPDELPYKVFKRLFKEYHSKKPFLRKLEKIIELTWENYFCGQIKQTLFNLVECNSAQDDPYKQGEHYIGITSNCSYGCEIDDFLKSQQNNLNILANINITKLNIESHHKGSFQNIKSISIDILKGKSARGKLCKETSDAIISIEAKASYPNIIIHSMDSHFKILCDILKIKKCVYTIHEIPHDKQL